jgi:hypothetical protein
MKLLLAFTVAILVAGAGCRSGSSSGPPTAAPGLTRTPSPPAEPTIDPRTAGTADVELAGDPFGGVLKDVRIGLHPELGGWDRIVFEFDNALPSVEIGYVSSVISCGPGLPVPVQGQAILAVRFEPGAAHNEQGQLTVPSTTVPGQGGVILEAKEYCDFEAVLQWAIGTKAKQPFKVTALNSPPRLVIDIKQ